MGRSIERFHVLCVLLFLIVIAPSEARAEALGEVGESCRARSDCVEGLRCIENTCSEPADDAGETIDECLVDGDCDAGQSCRDNFCVADEGGEGTAETADGEAAESGTEGEEADDSAGGDGRWADFELGGTHFFAGLTFAPGMTGFWPYGGNLPVWASFFFAFRLGVLFNRAELSMELSPATWVWDFDPGSHISGLDYEGNLNSLSFLVNIGGLVQLADNVYWPFRFGLGLSAHELPLAPVYMQGRLDVIGLVYQYGHLLFELTLPSIRFHSEFQNIGIWGWLFTLSISYVV